MVKKITFLAKVILLILIGYTFSYAIDLKIVPLKKPILEKEIKEKKISKTILKPKAKPIKKEVFGTKMRSVIKNANENGVAAIVKQQFEIAKMIIAAKLVPIIEPEVNINSDTKAEAEEILRGEIEKNLNALPEGEMVMLKLTIPEKAGLYDELAGHANVLRVVALSGGYSTAEACERLGKNRTMIASFSRALTEGLNVKMTDAEFNEALGQNIEKIYQASIC